MITLTEAQIEQAENDPAVEDARAEADQLLEDYQHPTATAALTPEEHDALGNAAWEARQVQKQVYLQAALGDEYGAWDGQGEEAEDEDGDLLTAAGELLKMYCGLNTGNWDSGTIADVKNNIVPLVRLDADVNDVNRWADAGLDICLDFSGPYTTAGVASINADSWVAAKISKLKGLGAARLARIKYVEAGNEWGGSWFMGPNVSKEPNTSAYRNLVQKFHAALVAEFGEATWEQGGKRPILGATLDGTGGLAFGRAWWTTACRAFVDAVTVHPYGLTSDFTKSMQGNRQLVLDALALTGLDLLISEVGWTTATGKSNTGDSIQISESQQATNWTNFVAWLAAQARPSTAKAGRALTAFCLVDFGSNNWYGLCHADRSHKPSVATYHKAAQAAMGGTAPPPVTPPVDPPPVVTPPANTPPTIAWSEGPAAGSTVKGKVTVAVSAADDSGVAKVEFSVDGTLVSTETFAPFVMMGDGAQWDSASVADGTHTITAKATAKDGAAVSLELHFTTDNVVDVPPPTPDGHAVFETRAQAQADALAHSTGQPITEVRRTVGVSRTFKSDGTEVIVKNLHP